MKYTLPFTIPSTDMDDHLRFTTLAMITAVQEVTSVHYASGGLSIPHLQRQGITWVLVKQRFEISEYPLWMDEVLLSTWAKQAKGPFFLRDFSFSFNKNGKKATLDQAFRDFQVKKEGFCKEEGSISAVEKEAAFSKPFLKGTSAWMVLDAKSLKPIRPSENVMGTLEMGTENALPSQFSKIPLAEDLGKKWDCVQEIEPTVLDIDVNDHVNNLSYIRWILSYLPKTFYKGMLIESIDTYFMSSALFNQRLLVRSSECEDGKLLHSIIRKDDGTDVFRAESRWKKAELLSRQACIE